MNVTCKSFSLCFIPGTLKFGRPELYMDNRLIPNVSECNYLGTIMCQKNCDLDIKRQMRNIYANVNMLLRQFSTIICTIKGMYYFVLTFASL